MPFNPLRATNPYGISPGAGAAYAKPQEPKFDEPTVAEQREAAILSLAFDLMKKRGFTAEDAFDQAEKFWRIAFDRAKALYQGEADAQA